MTVAGPRADRTMSAHRGSTTWQVLLVIVIAVGTVVAIRFATAEPEARSVRNLDIDTSTYDRIARTALTRGVGAIPPNQPPGFIMLLAAVYGAFGPCVLCAKVVLCLLLAATALLAALLAWKHVGPAEGVVAATLTIFSPLMVAYAACLQYEIPAAFAATLVAVLLLNGSGADGSRSIGRAVVIAAACSMAALIREVLVVLFPIALAVTLWPELSSSRLRRSLLLAAAMLSVYVGPIAVWSVIQYRNSGHLMILSAKADANFRIGNNPAANGTYHVQLEPVASPSGWDFIRARPAEVAALTARKILYFFGLRRDPWTVTPVGALTLHRALGGLLPFRWSLVVWRGGLTALLFLAGLWMLRHRACLWPLAAIVGSVMAVHVVYFSSQRFAVPVQPLIYTIAALPLVAVLRALHGRFGRASLVPAIALLAWILVAQRQSFPGGYHLEAEEMEGLSGTNVVDPLTANGRARFGAASKGMRPIAFLSAEPLPRGAYTIRVRARAANCPEPSAPAISISVRNEERRTEVDERFQASALCDPLRYATLEVSAVLPADTIVDLGVSSMGTVDLWVDSVEVVLGQRSESSREGTVGS